MPSGASLHSTNAGAAAATLSASDTSWSLQNGTEKAGVAMEMIVN